MENLINQLNTQLNKYEKISFQDPQDKLNAQIILSQAKKEQKIYSMKKQQYIQHLIYIWENDQTLGYQNWIFYHDLYCHKSVLRSLHKIKNNELQLHQYLSTIKNFENKLYSSLTNILSTQINNTSQLQDKELYLEQIQNKQCKQLDTIKEIQLSELDIDNNKCCDLKTQKNESFSEQSQISTEQSFQQLSSQSTLTHLQESNQIFSTDEIHKIQEDKLKQQQMNNQDTLQFSVLNISNLEQNTQEKLNDNCLNKCMNDVENTEKKNIQQQINLPNFINYNTKYISQFYLYDFQQNYTQQQKQQEQKSQNDFDSYFSQEEEFEHEEGIPQFNQGLVTQRKSI
ncbi:hypothetical protein PPERSA_02451 [Pseudocohnilembus persalinus]|uniref:Uncharacterized protein n=1 Tax=Pseudocohnilembus persalinus TaxID=266149 RepID=A0A0V0QB02_PSEPJ|nr:hypothetical protein PPERSA_02451 [Pseudocohnilembus persalinus]|eukprot:KRW99339.1 hypothetical protein PPERSA_02451 [Pseudocohnilembus persalinus]